MKAPQRGEVWLVDLGLAAKVRPAVAMSIPAGDVDRALVTLVPHTTSARGSRFEAAVSVPFLRAGVFDAQNLVTIPHGEADSRPWQTVAGPDSHRGTRDGPVAWPFAGSKQQPLRARACRTSSWLTSTSFWADNFLTVSKFTVNRADDGKLGAEHMRLTVRLSTNLR